MRLKIVLDILYIIDKAMCVVFIWTSVVLIFILMTANMLEEQISSLYNPAGIWRLLNTLLITAFWITLKLFGVLDDLIVPLITRFFEEKSIEDIGRDEDKIYRKDS